MTDSNYSETGGDLTDYSAESPPPEGTLFKSSAYKDENAPIVEFVGQRETETVAGHPSDKHAQEIAAENPPLGTTETVKVRLKTRRAGGFWDEGDVQELDEEVYRKGDSWVVVQEDHQ